MVDSVIERQVRWAPNGKSIAFINNTAGSSDIWLQPLDGSSPKPLTNSKSQLIPAFEWSLDGHSLAFVRTIETADVVIIEQKRERILNP